LAIAFTAERVPIAANSVEELLKMIMDRAFCLLIVFIAVIALAERVERVPGYPTLLPFTSYSGYLPVGDGQKQLFYWFVESQNKPAEDPVVLWLNGGPGNQ